MKNIFKFVLSLFTLAIMLLIGSNTLQTEEIKSDISINSIKKESFLLVTNNHSNAEASIRKKNNSSKFLTLTPAILSNFSYNFIFNNINSQLDWEFISSFVSLLNKGLYIRAP